MPLEITGVVAAQAFLLGFSKQDCGRGLRSKSKTEEKLYHAEIALERIVIVVACDFKFLLVGRWFMYQNVPQCARISKHPIPTKSTRSDFRELVLRDTLTSTKKLELHPTRETSEHSQFQRWTWLNNHPAILPPPPRRIELGHFGPIDGGTFLPCGILQNQNKGCPLGW